MSKKNYCYVVRLPIYTNGTLELKRVGKDLKVEELIESITDDEMIHASDEDRFSLYDDAWNSIRHYRNGTHFDPTAFEITDLYDWEY